MSYYFVLYKKLQRVCGKQGMFDVLAVIYVVIQVPQSTFFSLTVVQHCDSRMLRFYVTPDIKQTSHRALRVEPYSQLLEYISRSVNMKDN